MQYCDNNDNDDGNNNDENNDVLVIRPVSKDEIFMVMLIMMTVTMEVGFGVIGFVEYHSLTLDRI